MEETRPWFRKPKKPAPIKFIQSRSKLVIHSGPISNQVKPAQLGLLVNPPLGYPDDTVHQARSPFSDETPVEMRLPEARNEQDSKFSSQQTRESDSSPNKHPISVSSYQESAKDHQIAGKSHKETSSSPQHLKVPSSSYQERTTNLERSSSLEFENFGSQNQEKQLGAEPRFSAPAGSSLDQINELSFKPVNPLNQVISKPGYPFISVTPPTAGNDVIRISKQHNNNSNVEQKVNKRQKDWAASTSCKCSQLCRNYQSSKMLGFSIRLSVELRRWDVTSFCVQF